MNLKTTLVLLVVVAALVGLLFMQKDGDQEVAPTRRMLIEQAPEGGIAVLEVGLATREQMRLEQREGVWWLTEPNEDRADPEAVQRLIDVVMGNPRELVDANPDRELLELLGLEPPRARVALIGKDGDSIRFRAGERDPSGNLIHVLFEDDPALYRTGANLSNVLQKGVQEYRDKLFLGGDGSLLRRIEVHRPSGETLVLERPSTDWLMTAPRSFPADEAVVGELRALLLMKIDQQIMARPQRGNLLEAGLLEQTSTRVVFDWGEGRTKEARFAPPKPGYRDTIRGAISSERGHIVVVDDEVVKVLDRPFHDFRNRQVGRVLLGNARRIAVRHASGLEIELVYQQARQRFELTSPFARAVDGSRTGELFAWCREVSALRAEAFLDQEELPPVGDDDDPWDLLGFDAPAAMLEFEEVHRSGVTRTMRLAIAPPDGSGTVPVRRLDRYQDVAYLVAEDAVNKVLAVDPRLFLERVVFPSDLLTVKEFTIRAGDESRRIVRDPTRGAEYWRDPERDVDTSDLQEFAFSLQEEDVLEFLGRDPLPEDGLGAATVELLVADDEGQQTLLEVRLGHRDETGQTVLASASNLPARTLFRLDARILDQLLELLRQ